METREFLSKLDLDQLRHAKDLVGELLAERQKEQKKLVWIVGDEDIRLKSFSSDGYLQAAEFLLSQARENVVRKRRPRDMQLHLAAKLVPASEYDKWVDVHVAPPAAVGADSSEPMTLPAAQGLGRGLSLG